MTTHVPARTQPAFGVRWGTATDTGCQRPRNEDAFLARPPIFLVADGMGGHERGQEAAALVVDAFNKLSSTQWVTPQALGSATAAATRLVQDLGTRSTISAGSTVTGVGLASHGGVPAWLVFNIGDSRTYRLRSGVLEQVTVDHSVYQELVDQGATAEEADRSRSANAITRAIGGGMRQAALPDQWLLTADAGDRMLLCSDGLTRELSDELICATLLTTPDPGEAARKLVDSAVKAGGRDNVTVVVVDAVSVHRTGPRAEDGLDGDTLTDLVASSGQETP